MCTALTVKQVAERLNVNDRTVYRLAQAGQKREIVEARDDDLDGEEVP